MGKVYDVAYKAEACKRVIENGETVVLVSRELGISENTLYTWVSRYRQNSVKPFVYFPCKPLLNCVGLRFR